MDNQDNKNTKVKRTKEEIRLYNRLYYAYVRKNDKFEKINYACQEFRFGFIV